MLDKTLGIVLGTVPYSDNTQFVHIYTKNFGKVTYKTAIRQLRKKAQPRMAFAPLTLLEMDVEHSETKELQQIREIVVLSSPLSFGMSDPSKYAQSLFIAELVDKSVREVEENPLLWDFLQKSLEILFLPEFSSDCFHLVFTVSLFTPLGFGIDESIYLKGMCFDMNEGKFTSEPIFHPYYLNATSAEYLYRLLRTDYASINDLKLNKQERAIMLDILLAFLKIHIPEIGELKSKDVIGEIFWGS